MAFTMIDPEVGFTSDVIRDPRRFVGRADLIQDSIAALNSTQGLIAVYGKRGVGKSSLSDKYRPWRPGTTTWFVRRALRILSRNVLASTIQCTTRATR
jgi:hypothetical protein